MPRVSVRSIGDEAQTTYVYGPTQTLVVTHNGNGELPYSVMEYLPLWLNLPLLKNCASYSEAVSFAKQSVH